MTLVSVRSSLQKPARVDRTAAETERAVVWPFFLHPLHPRGGVLRAQTHGGVVQRIQHPGSGYCFSSVSAGLASPLATSLGMG